MKGRYRKAAMRNGSLKIQQRYCDRKYLEDFEVLMWKSAVRPFTTSSGERAIVDNFQHSDHSQACVLKVIHNIVGDG